MLLFTVKIIPPPCAQGIRHWRASKKTYGRYLVTKIVKTERKAKFYSSKMLTTKQKSAPCGVLIVPYYILLIDCL